MRIDTEHPRLYFDCNAHLAERSYALVQGTLEDLRGSGLTPEAAMGSRFAFAQEDAGENGEPDALLFNGTIAHNPAFGRLVLADPGGVHWFSEISGRDT